MTNSMKSQENVILPPEDLDSLLDLALFMEGLTEPGLLLGPDGERRPLPAEVYRVLVNVVETMRQGKAITVIPRTQRLTTQEAADFLGISRPTLVRLLEGGDIPFERPGRHRRVMLTDLLEFQERRRHERRSVLNQMTTDAGELGIYDGTPDDYRQALEKARKGHAQQAS
jgi:excisionase family DNA binding protein